MKSIRVSYARGPVLDWLAAKCLGEREDETLDPLTWLYTAKPTGCWDFCTNRELGGPIIEREHIDIRSTFTAGGYRTSQSVDAVQATINLPNNAATSDVGKMVCEYGPTPLIAAMRCYVVSKLGNVVEVPDELIKENR